MIPRKPIPRLERFKSYCTQQGIKLLYDDLQFIDEQLVNIYPGDHKRVLMNYIKKWYEGIGDTEKSLQAMNLGRKSANSWLVNYVRSQGKEKQQFLD